MKQFHARGLCNSTPWLAEAVRSRAFKTGSIGRLQEDDRDERERLIRRIERQQELDRWRY